MGYYEFPHTRNYDTDLGYLIKRYLELSTNFESLEKNFNDLKAWCISQLNSETLKTLVANKLDEWLQDGTLEALINNPLNHVTTYDTIVEMMTHSGLLEGSKIYCTGADNINDGKGGHFRIRARLSTDVIDNYNLYLIDGGIKVAERLDVQKNKDRYFIFIGDSYSIGTSGGEQVTNFGWVDQVINNLNLTSEEYTRVTFEDLSPTGVVSVPAFYPTAGSHRSFKTILETIVNRMNQTNIQKTTDIVLCGGYNEIFGDSVTLTEQGMEEYITYAKSIFPNATYWLGEIGYNTGLSTECIAARAFINSKVIPLYTNASRMGFTVMSGTTHLLWNNLQTTDTIHPNEQSYKLIGTAITNNLLCGAAELLPDNIGEISISNSNISISGLFNIKTNYKNTNIFGVMEITYTNEQPSSSFNSIFDVVAVENNSPYLLPSIGYVPLYNNICELYTSSNTFAGIAHVIVSLEQNNSIRIRYTPISSNITQNIKTIKGYKQNFIVDSAYC